MKKPAKTRTVHDFVDYGSGFPVVVSRVEMLPWGKDEIILIDHRKFPEAVIRALVEKPTRLTGNEIKFLRMHHEMPLTAFGKMLDVTHAAVKKWENKRDAATGMGWSTEMVIRLFALDKLGVRAKAFMQVYGRLTPPRPAGPCTIRVDLDAEPPEISYTNEQMAEAS